MELEKLTHHIIGASIEVHRILGPGLLESVYQACLLQELVRRRLKVDKERPIPVFFKGERLDCGFRADLIVNDAVLIELKAVDELQPRHTAQMMTYLRMSGMRVGLLINFNVPRLVDGVKRLDTYRDRMEVSGSVAVSRR